MMGRRKVAIESISEAQRSVRVLLAERDWFMLLPVLLQLIRKNPAK